MDLLDLPRNVFVDIFFNRLGNSSRQAARLASRGLRTCVDQHVDKLCIALPLVTSIEEAPCIAKRLAYSELRPTILELRTTYTQEEEASCIAKRRAPWLQLPAPWLQLRMFLLAANELPQTVTLTLKVSFILVVQTPSTPLSTPLHLRTSVQNHV